MGAGDLAPAALSATFNLTIVVLTVTGFAAALYTFYLSDDLEVLSATPLKERTIFSYKFLETLLTNSPLFLISALPISIAYGIVASDSVLSLVLLVVVLAAVSGLLLALPTAVCILLSMPLMRVLPASRAKEIVAGVGAILGAILYLVYLRLISPDTAAQQTEGTASEVLVSSLRTLLESPALTIPPGSWATAALSGAASFGWTTLAASLALLCALCVAAYLLCLTVAGWAYATGRAQAAESGARAGSSGIHGRFTGKLLEPLPHGVRAVASKELRILRRDFRRLASVAAPVIILLGAFFVNSGGLSGTADGSGDGSWFRPLISYLPAVAAGGILSALLAAYSVGAEGRAYWYLQASPLRPAEVLAGKLAASSLYGAGTALVCAVAITFLASAPSVAGILAGIFGGTVAAAVCGLYGVGVSAIFANFEGENPNQALSQMGNFIMVLLLFGLFAAAGIAAGLAFGLSLVLPAWLAVVLAVVVWAAGCAAGGYAVMASGTASLERMDQ